MSVNLADRPSKRKEKAVKKIAEVAKAALEMKWKLKLLLKNEYLAFIEKYTRRHRKQPLNPWKITYSIKLFETARAMLF